MNSELMEWLLLLGRWLHITVGVTWIGTSIFFMWLDRTIERNENNQTPGHVGELWMVHGGGFYHVEKKLMGPTAVPKHLHWFKWESYWTWLSGMFLMTLIFYTGSGTFLLDPTVSQITYGQAVALSLFTLIISWLVYDFLWESKIAKSKPVIAHAFTLFWFSGMTYFLCHTLSGRAAYIHIGGMLGTWMTANVFLRIIPRQVKMVEASKKGETVNQDWAKNAKNRSTHNTYFTLPVIFIMLSNHFPVTYGHRYHWVILLLISAAGAAIREYFVVRVKQPKRSKVFAAIGASLLLGVIFMTMTRSETKSDAVSASQDSELQHPAPQETVRAPIKKNHGTIQGLIQFSGTPPEPEKLKLPLVCSPDTKGEVTSNAVLIHNGKIKNVLVRILSVEPPKTPYPTPTETAVLDQVHCQYEPRVIAVQVGQKVDLVNSDPTFHNVRSFSKNNEEFNVAMPVQNQHILRTFSKSEISVQTKCSVHPWMVGYVAVMDHPFFTVTKADGTYHINNLPQGQYVIEAWHERFGTKRQEITISPDQVTNLDFIFEGNTK